MNIYIIIYIKLIVETLQFFNILSFTINKYFLMLFLWNLLLIWYFKFINFVKYYIIVNIPILNTVIIYFFLSFILY